MEMGAIFLGGGEAVGQTPLSFIGGDDCLETAPTGSSLVNLKPYVKRTTQVL